MIAKASELYDKFLNIYKTQYDNQTKAQNKRIKVHNMSYLLDYLLIDLYLDKDEDDLLSMATQENDEEVNSEPEETIAERMKLNPRNIKRKGTGLTIFDSKQLLTRLLILLAQIKARKNSNKLKNEIR